MNEDAVIAAVILIPSCLLLGLMFFSECDQDTFLFRWWRAIKAAFVALFTALATMRLPRRNSWAAYKKRLAKDAAKNLNYHLIRYLEAEIYDLVFHDGKGKHYEEPQTVGHRPHYMTYSNMSKREFKKAFPDGIPDEDRSSLKRNYENSIRGDYGW